MSGKKVGEIRLTWCTCQVSSHGKHHGSTVVDTLVHIDIEGTIGTAATSQETRGVLLGIQHLFLCLGVTDLVDLRGIAASAAVFVCFVCVCVCCVVCVCVCVCVKERF